jgi:thiamine pyrophosphokinase
VTFSAENKGFVSLFVPGGEAVVTVKGLSYELENAVLTDSYPLGVSNEFCGAEAEITVHEGDLLLVIENRP